MNFIEKWAKEKKLIMPIFPLPLRRAFEMDDLFA